MLLRVSHPHVVSVLAVCVEPGRHAIVMELMPLVSLFTLLHSSPDIAVDWPTRVRLALHAAQAVAHLHSLNPRILHCDIKSLNYLVAETVENGDRVYVVKCSDFGLSKTKSITSTYSTRRGREGERRGASQAMAPVGTLAWMAPELLEMAECTDKSDGLSAAAC